MEDFINQLVAGDLAHVAIVAIAVGLLVFGAIEWVDRIVSKDHTRPGLTPNAKFIAALVLSFVIPIGAYVVQVFQTGAHIALTGLFLACAVGYVASQGVHWATGGGQTASALHEAAQSPGVSVPIANSDVTVTLKKQA